MNKLISGLRDVFDPSDTINTEDVRRIFEDYESDKNDWSQYAHFDPHKYTRNLIDIGNGKYNLMLLCWGPGMSSSIHDHTDSHCFVKVLHGELLETRFAWPAAEITSMTNESGNENDRPIMPMARVATQRYKLNGVSYINDEIGLHRMENPSHSESAVTLHLYVPPYSHCNLFDERTGKRVKANVTFYTKFGQKVDYSNSAVV